MEEKDFTLSSDAERKSSPGAFVAAVLKNVFPADACMFYDLLPIFHFFGGYTNTCSSFVLSVADDLVLFV